MKDTWQEMGVDERRQTKTDQGSHAANAVSGHRGMFGNRPFYVGRLIIARRMIHGTWVKGNFLMPMGLDKTARTDFRF